MCTHTYGTVGLVALENKFAGQGFKILAFPCNEFDHQEPKSNEDIQKYALWCDCGRGCALCVRACVRACTCVHVRTCVRACRVS